jgi:hypothetical protein
LFGFLFVGLFFSSSLFWMLLACSGFEFCDLLFDFLGDVGFFSGSEELIVV